MEIHFGFSVEGLMIFLVPMIINIFYVIFPPKEMEKVATLKMPKLEAIEQGSRVAYAVTICILVSDTPIEDTSNFLYIAIVFLILYYAAWIRYYVGGRDNRLLGTKLLGIPMPLAVFPVLYFIFASLWLNNYIAAIIMIIFGVAHNIISYRNLYIKE